MKILAVVDSLRAGGAENLVLTLARAAPDAGFEVDVASLAGPDTAGVSPILDLAGAKPRFLSMSSLADPRTIPRLVDAIRRSRCDLVHAHLAYSATLAPPAARWAGRPCVCTFHHVPHPLSGREALRERLAVAIARRSAAVVPHRSPGTATPLSKRSVCWNNWSRSSRTFRSIATRAP